MASAAKAGPSARLIISACRVGPSARRWARVDAGSRSQIRSPTMRRMNNSARSARSSVADGSSGPAGSAWSALSAWSARVGLVAAGRAGLPGLGARRHLAGRATTAARAEAAPTPARPAPAPGGRRPRPGPRCRQSCVRRPPRAARHHLDQVGDLVLEGAGGPAAGRSGVTAPVVGHDAPVPEPTHQPGEAGGPIHRSVDQDDPLTSGRSGDRRTAPQDAQRR